MLVIVASFLFVVLAGFGIYTVMNPAAEESLVLDTEEIGVHTELVQESGAITAPALAPQAIPGCEEIKYADSRDYCYFVYAQSEKDVTLCSFIGNATHREQCQLEADPKPAQRNINSLGFHPDVISVNQSQEVFFSLRYSGVQERAISVVVEEIDEHGKVVREIGQLFDDGKDGDLVAGNFLYGRNLIIGPYPEETNVYFRAALVVPEKPSEKVYSPTIALLVTRFSTTCRGYGSAEVRVVRSLIFGTFIEDKLMVSFQEGTSPDRIEEILTQVGGEVICVRSGGLLSLYDVEISGAGTFGLLRAARTLRTFTEVRSAGVDYVGSLGLF